MLAHPCLNPYFKVIMLVQLWHITTHRRTSPRIATHSGVRWVGGWWMDGWIHGWMDGWMDSWMGGDGFVHRSGYLLKPAHFGKLLFLLCSCFCGVVDPLDLLRFNLDNLAKTQHRPTRPTAVSLDSRTSSCGRECGELSKQQPTLTNA